MPQRTDIETVRKFILDERRMREHVFRHKPHQRDRKLADCDNALAALRRIEANTIGPGLFDFSDELS